MKAVILAGGLGTRLSEETDKIPKPMVTIGGMPILWHIMKLYSYYGINEFIICCGYKGYVIKEYFSNYFLHKCDVTFDLRNGRNEMEVHQTTTEPWRVTLIDTGLETMTGGRLKRARAFLRPDEPFCMTYGDGVGDINIGALIEFHKGHRKLATVTSIETPGRFGVLHIADNKVTKFGEKIDGHPINGGFFVLEPETMDLINGDETVWEQEPLLNLANEGQLMAYSHQGFWQPMDTLRDKILLESLWDSGAAHWKLW